MISCETKFNDVVEIQKVKERSFSNEITCFEISSTQKLVLLGTKDGLFVYNIDNVMDSDLENAFKCKIENGQCRLMTLTKDESLFCVTSLLKHKNILSVFKTDQLLHEKEPVISEKQLTHEAKNICWNSAKNNVLIHLRNGDLLLYTYKNEKIKLLMDNKSLHPCSGGVFDDKGDSIAFGLENCNIIITDDIFNQKNLVKNPAPLRGEVVFIQFIDSSYLGLWYKKISVDKTAEYNFYVAPIEENKPCINFQSFGKDVTTENERFFLLKFSKWNLFLMASTNSDKLFLFSKTFGFKKKAPFSKIDPSVINIEKEKIGLRSFLPNKKGFKETTYVVFGTPQKLIFYAMEDKKNSSAKISQQASATNNIQSKESSEEMKEMKKRLQVLETQMKKMLTGKNDNKNVEDEDSEELSKAIEETIVSSTNKTFKDIIGLDDAKTALMESVVMPKRLPRLYKKRKSWQAILLYGPPGTGKTSLAEAIANETDLTYFSVSSSNLVSKYYGESARLIRCLFEKARICRPAVIFIDEVDSLLSSRDTSNEESNRIKTEFFKQMQGAFADNKDVIIIGATNKPEVLDDAATRRFQQRIYVGLPTESERDEIIHSLLKDKDHVLNDREIKQLSAQSVNFTGADLEVFINDAEMEPIREIIHSSFFKAVKSKEFKGREDENLYLVCDSEDENAIAMTWKDIPFDQGGDRPIRMSDFESALERTKPTVHPANMLNLQEYNKKYGM